MTWFDSWKENKKEVLSRDNYSDLSKVVAQFGELPEDKDISFPLKPGQIGRILTGQEKGYIYSRTGSPAKDELERRLRLFETESELVDAVVFSSGMAANSTTIEAIARLSNGKRFVCGGQLYSSTRENFERLLPNGLKTIFIDTSDPKKVRKVIEENGDIIAIFYETITNPALKYTDTREIADIVDGRFPIIVDNTWLTPYLQQPLTMGADIVVHSTSKYLNGEGDVLGGVIIGPQEFINAEFGPRYLRKHKGSVPGVTDVKKIAERLKTFPERMERHCYNAVEVLLYLMHSPFVKEVFPLHDDISGRTRDSNFGGVVSFMLNGENIEDIRERETRLMRFFAENEGPIKYKVSLGEPSSLIFGYLSIDNDEYLKKNKIPPGLVRLCVGSHKDPQEVVKYLELGLIAAYKN